MTGAPNATRGGLFGLTVARPIAMGVLFVTIVLIGIIAYTRIPLQFLPGGIQGSRFSVVVPTRGSSPQENADQVARVLEEQFETIPGIKDVRSSSTDGRVRLRIEYAGEVQPELAKAELRDRIERARPLMPDDIDRIWVWASDDGDMPIMWFAIRARERGANVTALIDNEVQKQLEGVDGVSRVSIWGLLDESIRVLLDGDKVAAANIDIGALITRLSTDNFAEPLGEVADGGTEFILRSDMRFKSLAEIEDYPVKPGIKVSDIARVERVNSIRERVTRIDGEYAYYGMIQKEGSANVVAVGEELRRVMEGFAEDPKLKDSIRAQIFFNQADFIQNSLDRLKSTALQGGGLAVLVLLLFLRRARMTLCVALCIPVSALLAVAFESFRGGSFNVLTMTGLTLGIGMLVDNAVVVIESIARQRGMGKAPRDAAVLGARDVGLAVALATMTSVVVFLPLMFMGGGRMSVFLEALGIPLCASLLFSLIVALAFIPTASARVIGERPRWTRGPAALLARVGAVPVRLFAWIVGGVRAVAFGLFTLLHWIERIALFPMVRPLAVLLGGGALYLGYRAHAKGAAEGERAARLEALDVPGSLTGALEANPTPLYVVAGILACILVLAVPAWRGKARRRPVAPDSFVPRGTSPVAWMQSLNRGLLRWTLDHRIMAIALSVFAFFTVVVPAQNTAITAFGEDEDTSELTFWVDLEDNFSLAEASAEFRRYEDFVERYREEFEFESVVANFRAGGGDIDLRWSTRVDPELLDGYRQRLREELPRFAGHRVRFRGQDAVSDSSKQFITFEIRGSDADRLAELGEQAALILEGVAGLEDITPEAEDAPDQVLLDIDGEMAFSYGVNSQSALRSLGWNLRGQQIRDYQERENEVPLIVELDDERLPGLDTIRDLDVWNEEGPVPLATFSTLRFQSAPSRITRRNGQITTSITARVSDPTRQVELVEKGYAALDGLDLPRGYSLGKDASIAIQGAQEQSELLKALALAVVLVFLLMGILFESLLLPFSVLTTIPFALMGAAWTLFLTGIPMDSIGWIGCIILVGVVVNNGIVLIDKIHRLRSEEGLSRAEAVVEGAAARVRPIVMTALTTVVGLLPMVVDDAPSQGIDYRALATCIAGGLAICTFFTLWVVPLTYTLLDDFGAWVVRIFGRAWGRSGARAALPAGAAAGGVMAPEKGEAPR